MKDFVFIIPLTPKSLLNPVRQILLDMMIYALKKQTSNNWNALLVGEDEKEDGNLIYINSEKPLIPDYVKQLREKSGHTDKHHKIEIALQYIARSEKKPKYLIRLDDDDLISQTIISSIEKSGKGYDCYADKYHALYNIQNGKIALPHLPWMANSIFHKYEHAITVVNKVNLKLINCSHNELFHLYYADKNVLYSPKYSPIYLRILSETSMHIGSYEKLTYNAHANKYGFWYHYNLEDYQECIELLINKYQNHHGTKITRNTGKIGLIMALLTYHLSKSAKKILRKAGLP